MDTLKENICKDFILSELMDFIENKKELLVPVYVVYGQYEDVCVNSLIFFIFYFFLKIIFHMYIMKNHILFF